MTSTLVPSPPQLPAPVFLAPAPPRRRRWRLEALIVAACAAALVAAVATFARSLAVASVLSLPFLYLLARRPVLRRLATRNAVRRPREMALILLGALLGTAIVTSSYVVGDTLRASIRHNAYTQLGPVDVEVLTDPAGAGPALHAIDTAAASGALRNIDGILPLRSLSASVATVGAAPRAEPQAQVLEVDFGGGAAFGGRSAGGGLVGQTPVGDDAVVGADLAATLGVRQGQHVVVYAYGTSRVLRVDRILPKVGLAGLMPVGTTDSQSPNLFVAPGTLASMQASAHGGSGPPPTEVIAISARGGVISGAVRTPALRAALQSALAGQSADIRTVKADLLASAQRNGASFSNFFQEFGLFGVLAGVLLLINMFVMLAQERKLTLGMLRAVGLRRSGLIGSFSLEGWLYALGSSVLGAAAGIGVGRVVVVVAARVFNSGARKSDTLALHFAASGHSVARGFSIGFVIALVTVVMASMYVARLNVIRAIRDLPEPRREGRHLGVVVAGAVVGGIGLAVTGLGLVSASAVLALVGPALVGLGVIAVARTVAMRVRVSVVSLLVLGWEVFAFQLIHAAFAKAGIGTFVAQGIILIAYAVALVTENQELIGAAVRAVGGGSRNMSLRLGLAYPLAKRFRTGLTLAMYSIVVFFLVFLSVFSHLFASQVGSQTRLAGGAAAIEVSSNPANPVPAHPVSRIPGVSFVTTTTQTTADVRADGPAASAGTQQVQVVGVDASFAGHGSPALHTRPAGVSSDDALWRQVAADPGLVLVGRDLGAASNAPPGPAPVIGSTITVQDTTTGQEATLRIAGTVEQAGFDAYDHVYVSRAFAERFFGERAAPTLLYVGTSRGADAEHVASRINGSFVANGADANTFHRLVTRSLGQSLQFFTLLKGYVALGLLVGIAGLGVVMVRAVRERRREVGVLRSLGFARVAVRRAFMAESSFVALEGIGVGVALALVTAWRTVDSHAFGQGLTFSVPWLELAILVGAAFVASLLATAAPAVSASRIRPAVALRLSD